MAKCLQNAAHNRVPGLSSLKIKNTTTTNRNIVIIIIINIIVTLGKKNSKQCQKKISIDKQHYK